MNDQDKTKDQLIFELEDLRRQVVALQGIERQHRQAKEAMQKAHDELEQRASEITARKAAEDALRASEERFRITFEEAPVGMVICVGDGIITKANRAVCRMSGYSQEELVGRHVRDLAHPEDRELSAPLVKKLLAGEIANFTLEKRYLRKDGQPFWAQATTAAAHGPDGKIVFALGVVEFIDDRKRAEEALRQSERRFRNYFEQGLIGMAVTSLDKCWLEVNDRLCVMLGYSREELLQSNWVELTYAEDREPNFRLFNRLVAGEIEHFTLNKRYVKRDGSLVHTTIHTRAFRQDNGTIDHIVTLIEDITARKQAEEALRESEEKYRTLVEMSPDAVIMTDLEGHVTFASPRARQMYGSENAEELLGRNPLDFFAPEDHQKFLTKLRETLEEGVTKDVEYELVKKDGTRFAGATSAAIIPDATGKPRGFVAVVRDITERRRAHEALLRERRTLKHMLEASDHERQLIAYDIHDGLAQELAGAMMQFQIYAHAQKSQPKDAAKAFEAGIAMLERSHIEARRLISGVRPPILDESGVVPAIAHLVYDPAFDEGPKIDFRNRVTFKRLDPVLENVIYRIVQEGLTNARHHSKSSKILVSLRQRDDRLRIEIRDWGVGFDAQAVQENRFGLQGIRERARLLGGKCSIKSRTGAGTTIIVELPIAEREAT